MTTSCLQMMRVTLGIHEYLPEADGYLFDHMASRGAVEDGEEFFEEDGSGSASPGLPAGPLPGQFYW